MRSTCLALLLVSCGPAAPLGSSTSPDSSTADSATPDSGTDSGGEEGDASGRILISELMASNRGTLEDAAGESPDWVELYNPGPEVVELEGWTLSDDADEPDRGVLPAVTLPPGGFLLLLASGSTEGAGGEVHLPFQLSSEGESLWLREPDGRLADAVDFPAQRSDVSWGRPQLVESLALLGPGSPARAAGSPTGDWTGTDHDDGAWTEVILPVGFDALDVESGEDLALFAETEQSSDYGSFDGSEAVDGEWSTFSHTNTGDMEPWWRVDLGESATISSLLLLNRIGCCPERLYNITVEVEDAEGQVVWSSAVLNEVASTPVDPGDTLDPGLEETVTGRFVRVSKEAVGGVYESEWLSLAEVQVGGVLLAPYELWIQTDGTELFASGEAGFRATLDTGGFPVDRLRLELLADDGATLWIDGALVLEQNVGDSAVPVEIEDAVVVDLDPALLGAGSAVLAALVVDLDGEDALLGLSLEAQSIETLVDERAFFGLPTPGEPNGTGWQALLDAPLVDPPRGFYEAPFVASISSPVAGSTLVYTLDGSLPTEDHGTVVEGGADGAKVELEVDTTATLRVLALGEDLGDSEVATHTWLFLEDVVRQPAAPDGVPVTWDGLAQAAIAGDYEMDPEVALDPAYATDLLAGLRAIPTLSIVMDPEDLWGAATGIYVHSTQRGSEWERPASLELIEPDGSTGFAEQAGVRIHGYGWRPHSNTRKHSLRLEFTRDYGASKLEYPLFPEAPVDRFDSIVLRSQGSRSWQDFRDPEQAQYIRDAFARDTALAMGKADGHAAYVHLYLNGLYWGLYMAVERPDGDFGAERFGGSSEDYDAINRRTSTNEAIDGDLEAYNTLLALSDADLSAPGAYEAVAEMVDVDDLIDYMLIHQYTSNRDGPEQFSHNNMRGLRRRQDGERFRFFVWDMEYSLWSATDHINIDVDVAGSASHVYARLREVPEFRERYAERAAMHLGEGGALSPEACLDRWEARAVEIEDAVVGESARWGDTDRATPYTRDVEWAEERRRLVEEYFPARTAVLVEQLRAAGLYED